MIDRKRLRELAMAADAGPWVAQPDGWTVRVEQPDTEQDRGWRICMTRNSGPHRVAQEVRNAAFIAAANPQTVLALLDALDAAQPTDDARDAARYRWLRTFAERQNGYWKINVNLHAADNIDGAIDIASQGAKGEG